MLMKMANDSTIWPKSAFSSKKTGTYNRLYTFFIKKQNTKKPVTIKNIQTIIWAKVDFPKFLSFLRCDCYECFLCYSPIFQIILKYITFQLVRPQLECESDLIINNNIGPTNRNIQQQLMVLVKLVQSLLGFKAKKSLILEQRNSILKLLLLMNIPSIIVILLFNKYAPQVYMDEYFHYNQFLQYFHGNYHIWDTKITTPPGIYHIQKLISYITGPSLLAMRAINSLIFGNLFLVFSMKIYQFKDHNVNNISRSLNVALTPTIFFFNFLDYTDSASLTLVTMAYYYCLVGSAWRMGFCSLLAIYVRQNNIIWCFYLLIYRVICYYQSSIANIRGNIIRSVIQFFKITLLNSRQIVIKNYVQLGIFPIFIWYLYKYNDGHLVFGDRENHQASFHPTQFLYLSLFIFFNLPITINDYVYAIKQTINRLYFSRHAFAAYLFLVSGCIVIVDKWTLVHPFILADNRHYIFYIYRYFRWSRYVLCGIYPFFIISITRIVISSNDKFIKFIVWTIISMIYLMLSPLVQVRYFTIPFVMIAFQVTNRNLTFDIESVHKKQIKQEKWTNRMIFPTLFKILTNLFIFYMFLFRKFGQSGQSRFIW